MLANHLSRIRALVLRHIAIRQCQRKVCCEIERHELIWPLSAAQPSAHSITAGEVRSADRGRHAAPSASGRGGVLDPAASRFRPRRPRRRLGPMRCTQPGLAALLAIAAIWLLAASRWIVDRHGRALGRQEPVLCVLPLPRVRHPRRPRAVLEPLSLRRASERRRPAVADLLARLRAVGVVRSHALDPRLRPHRLRAPAASAGWLSARWAGARAGRCRPRSSPPPIFMFGGPGLGPAAAHRHHPELRPASAGAAAAADGAAAPLHPDCGRLRGGGGDAGARPQPRGAAAVLRARRRARGRDRARAGRQAPLSARARGPCWRRWASSPLRCSPCRCC